MNFKNEIVFARQLLLRILGLVLVWMVCRILFYSFNADSFPVSNIGNFLKLLFFGVRFDLAAICYVNALLILSYAIPFPFRKNDFYLKIQKWIFIVFNSIALSAEVGDMGYFRFSLRRAIGSDINLIGETTNMTGQFIKDFWYLLLVYALLIFLLTFIFKKTTISYPSEKNKWWIQIMLFPIISGLAIIGMRGGLQLRPVMSLTTAQYVDDMRLMPLQTNTTLNLLFSFQQDFIEEKKYYEDKEALQLYNIYKNPSPSGAFKKENVFIIVLESFGKEHIGYFNPPENGEIIYENSPTPFLDSLIEESWNFENAYASGVRSTQGIAAIAASIPSLMEMTMIFSPYQGNRVQGLAYHLEKKGYSSGFFHGSNPGSMEFERFSKSIGYENFYDKTAYPNQEDYDGNWGIWDRPFFQYTLNEVNKYNKPFTALLFSLTSHHPYYVEDFFEKKYPEEKPILRAIRYTDFALKELFETAKKMDWYENTLFVITADHIGRTTRQKYKTKVGAHQIPLLFFKPNSNLKGSYKGIVQQTDILPTVLDYLNYDEPYVAFGQSALDTTANRYSYLYNSGFYQILNDSIWLSFDQEKIVGVRNYKNDVLLKDDITGKNKNLELKLTKQLKAAIQVHHQAMVKNKMAVD